jgi:hypothetical protein
MDTVAATRMPKQRTNTGELYHGLAEALKSERRCLHLSAVGTHTADICSSFRATALPFE